MFYVEDNIPSLWQSRRHLRDPLFLLTARVKLSEVVDRDERAIK